MFSQVGGFLGLLLGASILTVCEIVDFIVLAVAAAWHQKKSRGQVIQSEAAEQDEKQFPAVGSTISTLTLENIKT